MQAGPFVALCVHLFFIQQLVSQMWNCSNHYLSVSRSREVIVKTGMNDEYQRLCIFSCSICCGTIRIPSDFFHLFALVFFFFAFQSIAVFFSFLIIFSHFLHTVGAVKWPIVKEQTVCVWDISCWFSGTLAWWMARQKTPNNSWFASRETCSLRLNNVKLSLVYILHLLRTSTAPFHSRGNSRPYQFQIEQ